MQGVLESLFRAPCEFGEGIKPGFLCIHGVPQIGVVEGILKHVAPFVGIAAGFPPPPRKVALEFPNPAKKEKERNHTKTTATRNTKTPSAEFWPKVLRTYKNKKAQIHPPTKKTKQKKQKQGKQNILQLAKNTRARLHLGLGRLRMAPCAPRDLRGAQGEPCASGRA